MKKITQNQIQSLARIAKMDDYETARRTRDEAEIDGGTYTTDPAIAELMVQAYFACTKPEDKGRLGRRLEAEQRLDLRCHWNHFRWLWRDCWKRPDCQQDSEFYINGIRYTCESKSGCGDWQRVHTPNLAEAIEEMASKKEKNFIRWHNELFDIMLPWAEFYSALAEYNTKKGCLTWFNSQIKKAPLEGEFIVRNQPFRNSPPKLRFLALLEERSFNWGEAAFNRRLVRNNELDD